MEMVTLQILESVFPLFGSSLGLVNEDIPLFSKYEKVALFVVFHTNNNICKAISE